MKLVAETERMEGNTERVYQPLEHRDFVKPPDGIPHTKRLKFQHYAFVLLDAINTIY